MIQNQHSFVHYYKEKREVTGADNSKLFFISLSN